MNYYELIIQIKSKGNKLYYANKSIFTYKEIQKDAHSLSYRHRES